MAEIAMVSCDSSFISAFGFDPDTETLRVQYKKDGATLDYLNVPQLEYDRMRNDPRPGSYFRTHIYKAGYQWNRV